VKGLEVDEERWRNVEIRIIYPVPDDQYDLHEDERFDDLVDAVYELYPDAVMSGQIVWSDAV